MSQDMYKANILDHYKHPRNYGTIDGVENHAHVSNPLCGDELDVYLALDERGRVTDIKFTGRGCTISMAAASMLTEKILTMNQAGIDKLTTDDIMKLLGVVVNPARLKCATLSLKAVQQALHHHHV